MSFAVVFGSANNSSFVASSRAYVSSLMETSMDELHVEILAIPLLAHDLELRQLLSLILRIDRRITASQLVFNKCSIKRVGLTSSTAHYLGRDLPGILGEFLIL
jgi:hypothetical protein